MNDATETRVLERIEPGGALAEVAQVARLVAESEFVPGALRRRPAAIAAAILLGRELGVGPLVALGEISVVDGRPVLSAKLTRALVQRAGHELWLEELSDERVTVAGQRRGSARVTRVTWTLRDAARAGLTKRHAWERYPRHLLAARATSELVRLVFADVVLGLAAPALPAGVLDALEVDPAAGDVAAELLAEAAEAERTPPPEDQRRRLFALVAELGVEGRERRMAMLAAAVGRDVASSKELDDREVAQVVSALEAVAFGDLELVFEDDDDGTHARFADPGEAGEQTPTASGADW